MTTQRDLEERIGEIDGVKVTFRHIGEHIDCAETVETEADFNANIKEAIASTKTLLDELKELLQ